jgi:hypothetical protein
MATMPLCDPLALLGAIIGRLKRPELGEFVHDAPDARPLAYPELATSLLGESRPGGALAAGGAHPASKDKKK